MAELSHPNHVVHFLKATTIIRSKWYAFDLEAKVRWVKLMILYSSLSPPPSSTGISVRYIRVLEAAQSIHGP